MDGTRGGAAISETKCRRPARALPPPVSMAAFTAAGFSTGLLLGASASTRLRQRETHPFGVGPVQVRVRDHTLRRLRGRQVGLHDAAQQRIARPARVGEPAVPPGRLNLRAAHRDAGHLAQQLPPPPGHQPGPGGQRRRQPQAGAARVHPAQRTEDRIGEQQVQRRRRGLGSGGPGRVVVGAHYQPSLGRGARSSIGRSSRTRTQTWVRGHRRAGFRRPSAGPWRPRRRARDRGGAPALRPPGAAGGRRSLNSVQGVGVPPLLLDDSGDERGCGNPRRGCWRRAGTEDMPGPPMIRSFTLIVQVNPTLEYDDLNCQVLPDIFLTVLRHRRSAEQGQDLA